MEIPKIIHINQKDNVVISLFEIPPGEDILVSDGVRIITREKIPASHKIAIKDFKKGEAVIKFGEEIGRTNQDIPRGSWIHVHNIVGPDAFDEMLNEVFKEGEAK